MRIILRASKMLTSVERGTTLGKRITVHTNRAGAHDAMVAGKTKGADTTHIRFRGDSARIDTLIAITSLIDVTILFKEKKKDCFEICF